MALLLIHVITLMDFSNVKGFRIDTHHGKPAM